MSDLKSAIINGKTFLGMELGSTRIKTVLIDENHEPIASGSHDWENRYENGVWTYSLDDIWTGVQDSYKNMAQDVESKYGVKLEKIGAMGFSAMMHGYMAFDKDDQLLVPFRTWRNTITKEATEELTEIFKFNIPQRWSAAHLRQAMLNKEPHVGDISFLTTLAGYIHWKLCGEKVIGIGDASGMFPIDEKILDYNEDMRKKFDELCEKDGYSWRLGDILPKVLVAGERAGTLTKEGAKLLDTTGTLQAGALLCPPEGDAGTGMAATNSVAKRTGNVSAGTSVFAMIVLEKDLTGVYPEIDIVTTPTGSPVAMVHSNNCTSDLNAWVSLFGEFTEAIGVKMSANDLYGTLYRKALTGDADCGGLLSYCYFSGEHITGFEEGRPLFVRTSEDKFNLANFMRTHLYTALGALKIGMDILLKKENVKVEQIMGQGGLFKTEEVGQRVMAAAMNAPVAVMTTAGEGGAWGIAILASYAFHNETTNSNLEDFLNEKVFGNTTCVRMEPDAKDVEGFEKFMDRYRKGLVIEQAAVDALR